MVRDPQYDDEFVEKKVAVWNPTFANLTLMALGSSAPEIILNIYETCITYCTQCEEQPNLFLIYTILIPPPEPNEGLIIVSFYSYT